MKNIPLDQSILAQLLKAGYIFEENLFPTDRSTPHGGIISPTLANMTLDGIEGLLAARVPKMKVHFVDHQQKIWMMKMNKQAGLRLIIEYLKYPIPLGTC